jgi:hypothetical protein
VHPFVPGGGLGRYVAATAETLAALGEVVVFTSSIHEGRYRDLRKARSPDLPAGVRFIFVDEPETAVGVTGSPVGSSDGVFATFQADYWGRGERIGQFIATYNFGGNYLWSRAKGGTRFGSLTSPLFVGAELIFQGGGEDTALGIPNSWVLQAGPVLMLQLTPNFRVDLSGGVRVPIDDPAEEATGGYGRIEFVAVLPRFFTFR